MRRGKRKIKDFNKTWGRYVDSLGRAVDFLRENFCVLNDQFLPSENMLATLPVFFQQNRAQPSATQRTELRKWFWATALGQRYSGHGYRDNMLGDLRFFQRLAENGRARFGMDEPADKSDLLRAQYTQKSALTNAFFCLLAILKPRRFRNGEQFSEIAAARANKENKHHIFPKARLQRLRVGYKDYNGICNICLLPAEENQYFGDRRPSDYFREVRRNGRFVTTMGSHLIGHRGESAIWEGNVRKGFRRFRRERLDLLCKAFEKEARMKLFRREA
jgi:hypothetical protein